MADRTLPEPSAAQLALDRALALIETGCADLRRATGLDIDPALAAEELRHEASAAALCARVDRACRAELGAEAARGALRGVEGLLAGARALREALEAVARDHAHEARAISAYQENN